MSASELARRAKFSFGTGTFASDLGLTIVDGVEFDDWVEIGSRVLRFNEASAWWIGDWLAYGDYRYGEKYRPLVEQLGLKYDRIRDYAYVSSNVPITVRRAELTWMHHRAVAKLVPVDQERWLTRAVDEGMTSRQLRDAIAGGDHQELGSGDSAVLEQLRFAVETPRLERWQAAAAARGQTVQEWAVWALDKEAQSG